MSEDAYLDRMFDLAIASKQALDEHVELVRLRTDHAELQRKYTKALDVSVKQAGNNTALFLRFALAGLTVPQLETVGYADNLWAEVTSALKEAEAAMQSAWYELESQKVPFAQFISQPDMDTKLTIVRQAIDHATQLKPIQEAVCDVAVTMPAEEWARMVYYIRPVCRKSSNTRIPRLSLISEALNAPCEACGGLPRTGEACVVCGGSGKCGVPGCTLLPRGLHLEIK